MSGISLLVCGGRAYADIELIGEWLSGIERDFGIDKLIQGGAGGGHAKNVFGADFIAQLYGRLRQINVKTYPADWTKYNRGAGPRRNQRMIDSEAPQLVLAFPGGSGTFDMVSRARAHHIPVIEVAKAQRYDDNMVRKWLVDLVVLNDQNRIS